MLTAEMSQQQQLFPNLKGEDNHALPFIMNSFNTVYQEAVLCESFLGKYEKAQSTADVFCQFNGACTGEIPSSHMKEGSSRGEFRILDPGTKWSYRRPFFNSPCILLLAILQGFNGVVTNITIMFQLVL